jgi:hypothetical protein
LTSLVDHRGLWRGHEHEAVNAKRDIGMEQRFIECGSERRVTS